MPRLTLDEMLVLPWNWQGPKRTKNQDGSEHYEMRIAELADFFLAAESKDGVLDQLVPALKAYLQSYIERGETVPSPAAVGTWQFVVPQKQRAATETATVYATLSRPVPA